MKKLLLLATLSLTALSASAQNDTLLWNDFNSDPAAYMQIAIPLGGNNDTSWYTFDLDGLADGSSQSRPGEWFWSQAFADLDTVNNPGVMGSNSWTNNPLPVDNILVTPAVFIGDTNAVLYWKSAPYQTPRYLDGYRVVIAVNDNDLGSFNDTIFVAGEYVSLDNTNFPNSFSSYTFAPVPTADPMDPFIHGMDLTYVDPNTTDASDSSRLLGRLRPFQVSLAAYSGSTIYVQFLHHTVDDNLLELDDVLITGTNMTGIAERTNSFTFSAWPNPTNDVLNMSYTLENATSVIVNVYDVTGKLVSTENKGNLSAGPQQTSISVSSLPAGVYRVELVTENGTANNKVIVQ